MNYDKQMMSLEGESEEVTQALKVIKGLEEGEHILETSQNTGPVYPLVRGRKQ